MNVFWPLITVIQMLTVPTQMDLSTVHVTKDTVATENCVKVIVNNPFNQNNSLKFIKSLFMKYIYIFCDILSILIFLDIDECMIKIDNRDPNAYCTDTSGSFNCTCNNGYSGNGTLCQG